MIAGILGAGLLGIVNKLECPEPAYGMAYDNEGAPVLPTTFTDALHALEADHELRGLISDSLVEVFLTMKRDELERYNSEVGQLHGRTVSDWEIREYMEDF
jgi:glutamine synthetase